MKPDRTKQIFRSGLVIMLFLLSSNFLHGQNTDELVKQFINSSRQGITNVEIYNLLEERPEDEVIHSFHPYVNDTLSNISLTAYRMIYKTALRAENKNARKKAVTIIVSGLQDNDAGNMGILISYLTDFNKSNFDPEAIYEINQLTKSKPPHHHKLILLTGYLDQQELLYDYRQMLNETGVYDNRTRWAMQLAMARMGDETSLNTVMQRVQALPVNDNLVYEVLPGLTYMRHKKTFDYMFGLIERQSKDCNSSDPDNEAPIICAYRIIEMVAPYVTDFPVDLDEAGDPVIHNYEGTLREVRNWIVDNKEDYALRKNKY